MTDRGHRPMKVYIGPYEKEILPIRDWARKCKLEFISDKLYDFANLISPINTLHKKRKIKVKIHSYDIWSLDHTLAQIIVPALILLKEKKQGAPWVDDEDVPENLRSTAAAPKENEWDTDEHHFARWDWVLDEMIWAFEQYKMDDDSRQFHYNIENLDIKTVKEDNDYSKLEFTVKDPSQPEYFYDREAHKQHEARKDNGRRLFAKYYNSLWD